MASDKLNEQRVGNGTGHETTNNGNDTEGLRDYQDLLAADRTDALIDALACCRSPDDYHAFLADLCTPQELRTLAERWLLARLLERGGLSYRAISDATGASTTTVGRVARFLQQEPHRGYQLVLDRLAGLEGDAHGTEPEQSPAAADRLPGPEKGTQT